MVEILAAIGLGAKESPGAGEGLVMGPWDDDLVGDWNQQLL
jgi:hypothetical protein